MSGIPFAVIRMLSVMAVKPSPTRRWNTASFSTITMFLHFSQIQTQHFYFCKLGVCRTWFYAGLLHSGTAEGNVCECLTSLGSQKWNTIPFMIDARLPTSQLYWICRFGWVCSLQEYSLWSCRSSARHLDQAECPTSPVWAPCCLRKCPDCTLEPLKACWHPALSPSQSQLDVKTSQWLWSWIIQ